VVSIFRFLGFVLVLPYMLLLLLIIVILDSSKCVYDTY